MSVVCSFNACAAGEADQPHTRQGHLVDGLKVHVGWSLTDTVSHEYNDYYPEGAFREARCPAVEVLNGNLKNHRSLPSDFVAVPAASEWDARRIYSNPGTTITKPKKDIAAIICVLVLIGLQTIGLCVLMWYILHAPTWTEDPAQHDADASSVRLSMAHDTSIHSIPIYLSISGEGLITRSAMKRIGTDSTVLYI